MAQAYKVSGNLAIKTQRSNTGRAVARIAPYQLTGVNENSARQKSDVEEMLDNLEGTPMAKTAGDRVFAIGTAFVSCAAFVLLTMLPIF